MDILWEILAFGAKGFVVFCTFAASAIIIFSLSRSRKESRGALKVRALNDRVADLRDDFRHSILPSKAYKRLHKQERKQRKQDKKQDEPRPRVFVMDFTGDLLASSVSSLRQEITAILEVAEEHDEVVLRLESPGGIVHGYGLAASQLARLRSKKIRLTVSVDKVAASGGYMMACVADEILAAPFAVVGSIGVIAQVPNAHRLLQKAGIDYNEMTAGEYKRTVSMFGEITDKGRQRFQEQLEDTHGLFKDFINEHRSDLDIDKVSNGEHWYGTRAKELGLIDRLLTSDDYLLSRMPEADVYEVAYKLPKGLRERIAETVSASVEQVIVAILGRASSLHQQ